MSTLLTSVKHSFYRHQLDALTNAEPTLMEIGPFINFAKMVITLYQTARKTLGELPRANVLFTDDIKHWEEVKTTCLSFIDVIDSCYQAHLAALDPDAEFLRIKLQALANLCAQVFFEEDRLARLESTVKTFEPSNKQLVALRKLEELNEQRTA